MIRWYDSALKMNTTSNMRKLKNKSFTSFHLQCNTRNWVITWIGYFYFNPFVPKRLQSGWCCDGNSYNVRFCEEFDFGMNSLHVAISNAHVISKKTHFIWGTLASRILAYSKKNCTKYMIIQKSTSKYKIVHYNISYY